MNVCYDICTFSNLLAVVKSTKTIKIIFQDKDFTEYKSTAIKSQKYLLEKQNANGSVKNSNPLCMKANWSL